MSEDSSHDDTSARRLLSLVTGYYVSSALYVLVALRIPDLLGAGGQTLDALADATATAPDALRRLLRLAAATGILVEGAEGRFRLTALGERLRADAPRSMRDVVLHFTRPRQQRTWDDLLETVRAGRPPAARSGSGDFFSGLAGDPDAAAAFHGAMRFFSEEVGAAVVRSSYDFGRFETLVDVGGGYGALLADVLEANPRLRGVLFELASVLDGAERLLADRGLSDRCTFVAGDFFVDPLPAGADAYLLKDVLSDYDDRRARSILESCRRAMHGNAVLIVIANILPEPTEPSDVNVLRVGSDVNILVQLGGRERTEPELRALAGVAGLELREVVPLGDTPSQLAATPSIAELGSP